MNSSTSINATSHEGSKHRPVPTTTRNDELGTKNAKSSVFWENVRFWEPVFGTVLEKVFLSRDLRLGPASRANTDDSAGANGFDDQVGLKPDLDAATAERDFASCAGDIEDFPTGRHVGGAVVASGVLERVFGTIHLRADAVLKVVVE